MDRFCVNVPAFLEHDDVKDGRQHLLKNFWPHFYDLDEGVVLRGNVASPGGKQKG